MPLLPGQILCNRYRIIKLIGQGGFGAVYGAWDTSVNRICAVKENLDTSAEAQRQFEREATLLAKLRHPNLPLVTDHFVIPSQGQYLVMDFVEGEDLEEMLEKRGVLPERQVVGWINQVCTALAYLHGQPSPIIHRDIKPANLKIQPDGRVMLVDFGIAKVYQGSKSTTVGAKAVTPGYSPPEQYGHGHTDARSDIYALGATLYTSLTGHAPPEAIDRLVQHTPLTSPRRLNPKISPTVEQAILKAMAVVAVDRFKNVAEFQGALTGRAVPISGWSMAGLFVSVVAVVILIGGLTMSMTGMVNLNELVNRLRIPPRVIILPTPTPVSTVAIPDEQHSAEFATAYNNEGISDYDQGDYDQAIENFNRAIQLKPNFGEAYSNRGLAFRQKGDYRQALADYNRAIQLQFNFASAYLGRADVYYLTGDYDRAIADYDKFLALNEDVQLEQYAQEQLRLLKEK